MSSPPSPSAPSDLGSLYQLCRELSQTPNVAAREALVQAVLLHPASLRRFRGACIAAMKGWYRRGDLRGDVMQEASLRVGEKILRGTLVYEDRGLEKFGAWLWMIWLNACRSAWRHCHPLWLDGMTLCDPQQLARFSFEIRDLSPANELLWIVYERGDRLTQDALLAWLGGLSLRASAKDLGLTKAAVVKLRRQLVGMFRAARRQIDEERGR